MKAVMVMFDSLNRRYLPPYGCDWVKAPNFERLARRTVAFDRCYAGSMPCMPARRELHTGRYNFMHRFWGPLEPFDDSMPEMLRFAGIHSHLISDHQHYWEDGGATYHNRYSSWECVRGQEGDFWKVNLDPSIQGNTNIPDLNPQVAKMKKIKYRQDAINRTYRKDMEHSCQTEVFDRGLEFIDTNHSYDNWFLTIESFDPHEPFFTYEEFLKLYQAPDIGKTLDWPPYAKVNEPEEIVEYMRAHYAAMISMCDQNLGRVLDAMDEHDLWKDTMLIVCTDHGYMLGEHGWWAKNMMPCWNEIINTPLFIWDPRCGKQDEHRQALVQTIDLAPTLLKYFGLEPTKDMQGHDLAASVDHDEKVRDYALYGYFGNQMNITDGEWTYMRNAADPDVQLYEYTLMPCNMNKRMGKELEQAVLAEPFSFTKNMPLLKIPSASYAYRITSQYGSLLYDLNSDPEQVNPLDNKEKETELCAAMKKLMDESEAPPELYERMGL